MAWLEGRAVGDRHEQGTANADDDPLTSSFLLFMERDEADVNEARRSG